MEGVRIVARVLSRRAGDAFSTRELSQAASLLARAGRKGALQARGLRYVDQFISPLKPEDWMRLRIYENDTLEDPHHNPSTFRVRITRVVVDARDIRLLMTSLSHPPSHEPAYKTVDPIAEEASSEEAANDTTAEEEQIRRRLREIVREWPSSKPKPGAKRTQELVEEVLQRKVNRARLRRLYKEIMPDADGRGRKRNPRN